MWAAGTLLVFCCLFLSATGGPSPGKWQSPLAAPQGFVPEIGRWHLGSSPGPFPGLEPPQAHGALMHGALHLLPSLTGASPPALMQHRPCTTVLCPDPSCLQGPNGEQGRAGRSPQTSGSFYTSEKALLGGAWSRLS
ncbi:hypothetical protein P7K49_009178 [Saguinus oedipus]|uniref:Uncharacterized protein n=1 Tax=Saguinus oedipus TaxID=9490 RepID=A0ABQ9VMB5_SAGOE|nr:hypothetical protein P7K49_009178 [Saguinus oedipus]